jgi:hypothetical protein
MSADEVADSQHLGLFRRHWPKLVIVLVILALVPVGLAFWPRSGLVGEKGTSQDARKIESYLRYFKRNLQPGRTIGPYQFTEQGINAYFEFTMVPKIRRSHKVDYMSVKVANGYLLVRVVKRLGGVSLGSFELAPKVSYDLACVPYQNRIVVSKASMGHVGLIGPAKGLAVGPMRKLMASQEDWEILAAVVTQIKAQPGTVLVWVKK